MDSGHNCELEKIYSEEHDCYYCKSCNSWLEDTCDDPACEFCAERPAHPVTEE